jgi:hypothetical protein
MGGFTDFGVLDVTGNVARHVSAAGRQLERGAETYQRGALILGADAVTGHAALPGFDVLRLELRERPVAEVGFDVAPHAPLVIGVGWSSRPW